MGGDLLQAGALIRLIRVIAVLSDKSVRVFVMTRINWGRYSKNRDRRLVQWDVRMYLRAEAGRMGTSRSYSFPSS